ncbi:MAG: choice-of-anchor Q domain-containing protein, partial [Bacteroidales bacterium]
GGGLYVDFFNNTTPQNISIEDCSITGNTAGTGGGGIYLNGGVYNPIKNCVINDNKLSADNDGAALYANKVVTLQNCVFANNSIFSGSTNKNIVRLVIESSNVYNCTFARNNSSTGGSTLNLTGVASTVTNCVFWGNTSPLILNSNLSTLSFNATDGVEITGASVSDNITTLNSTTNNTFVSPTTFQGVSTDATTKAQIAAADWSLMLGSPAINVGTDLSIATDLLGNPRPTGASAVDIGAYEGIFIADDKSISLYSTNSNINVLNMGNLTVNAAKTLNRVTIEAGGKINVSSGFPITAGIVTLKAAKDATTFNVKLDAAITATSVRLFKTIDDSKWYFMAFPCDVAVAGITKSDGTSLGTLGTDWFIKYYDGAKRANDGTGAGITNWVSVTSGTLTANRGYIFGLSTGTAETELLIPLNTSILAAEIGKSIAVEANTGSNVDITNHGWNLIGQPYLSQFVSQTGSDAPFMIMPNADGKTYSIKGKVAGTLPQINPFAAYFVQASGNGNINFGLTGRQSIPASVTNNMSEIVKLNLTTTTGNDETYLVMDNDQSPDYQIGMDMVKWLGTGTDIPQVYTQLNGVYYAFNSLPMNDVSNLPIGIYTKNAGNTTLSVNAAQAPSLSKLLLTDLSTSPATVTDLLISNYSFTATAGTDNSRFAITAKRVPTASVIETEVGAPNLLINNSKLTIQNLDKKTTVRVLDAIGRIVTDKVVNNNTMEISLPIAGMYIVQIESGAKNWTRKFVVQ